MANQRNIGFVFQNYALFPHLTVFENVAYGLRVQRQAEAEIARAVGEVLDLVGLAGYERQMPHQLSGGEQQRVALARAIVIQPAGPALRRAAVQPRRAGCASRCAARSSGSRSRSASRRST